MIFQISKATFYLAFMGSLTALTEVQAEDYYGYTGNMVKMCLFYPGPSGHARSDPILNQQCASDHVHSVRNDCLCSLHYFRLHDAFNLVLHVFN